MLIGTITVLIDGLFVQQNRIEEIEDMVIDVSKEYKFSPELSHNLRNLMVKSTLKEKFDEDLKFVFSILPKHLLDETTNEIFLKGTKEC